MSSETTDGKAGAAALLLRTETITRWSRAPYLAEGIGTFGLVFAGCGAIMIDKLSGGQVTHVGVGLVFGHISGAHFNPAVHWVLCSRAISRLDAWWVTG